MALHLPLHPPLNLDSGVNVKARPMTYPHTQRSVFASPQSTFLSLFRLFPSLFFSQRRREDFSSSADLREDLTFYSDPFEVFLFLIRGISQRGEVTP